MNTYEAVMAAADQVEREPDHYNFSTRSLPPRGKPTCGTAACAIGWVAYFNTAYTPQRTSDYYFWDSPDAPKIVGCEETTFYVRMGVLAARHGMNSLNWSNTFRPTHLQVFQDFKGSPADTAKLLRLYAQEYLNHLKPVPVELPAAVKPSWPRRIWRRKSRTGIGFLPTIFRALVKIIAVRRAARSGGIWRFAISSMGLARMGVAGLRVTVSMIWGFRKYRSMNA